MASACYSPTAANDTARMTPSAMGMRLFSSAPPSPSSVPRRLLRRYGCCYSYDPNELFSASASSPRGCCLSYIPDSSSSSCRAPLGQHRYCLLRPRLSTRTLPLVQLQLLPSRFELFSANTATTTSPATAPTTAPLPHPGEGGTGHRGTIHCVTSECPDTLDIGIRAILGSGLCVVLASISSLYSWW